MLPATRDDGFRFREVRLGGHPFGHVAPDRRGENPVVRLPAAERDREMRELTVLAAATT